jgi:hypothetical protein
MRHCKKCGCNSANDICNECNSSEQRRFEFVKYSRTTGNSYWEYHIYDIALTKKGFDVLYNERHISKNNYPSNKWEFWLSISNDADKDINFAICNDGCEVPIKFTSIEIDMICEYLRDEFMDNSLEIISKIMEHCLEILRCGVEV